MGQIACRTVLTTEAVRDVLVAAAAPREAVRQPVALAEEAGGPDTITIVVIDVREADAAFEPAEPVTIGSASAEAALC